MRKTNLVLVHDNRTALPLTPDKLADRDGQPRIHDLELAERLGFDRPRKLRELIQRNIGELRGYGEVFSTVEKTTAAGGRPGKENWLNEGQALVVCALSRTPKAAAVRKAVIEVFIAYRAGRLTPPPAAPAPQPALDVLRAEVQALARSADALLRRIDEQDRPAVGARRAARRLASQPTAAVPTPAAATALPPAGERGPMLMGVDAIAAHLGITLRQAKHRVATGALPAFKMGRAVCSTRDALDAFVASSLSAKEARPCDA